MKRIQVTDKVSVASAQQKLLRSLAVGVLAGVATGFLLTWKAAPLVAWDVAVIAFLLATWPHILKFNADVVKHHALREDPSRVMSELILLSASVISLGAVGLVLTHGGGLSPIAGAMLAVSSVVASWGLIHTIYTLRYAELYYRGTQRGIDFGDQKPVYSDFAYLAFTLGMTFQVSDTSLQTREFRAAGLKHALLSYLFGTVIIATTINLVGGLSK